MRNGIPQVRTWKVTLVDERGRAADAAFVDTINRRFALSLARERYGWYGAKLRASVCHPRRRCPACAHTMSHRHGNWYVGARKRSGTYLECDNCGAWTREPAPSGAESLPGPARGPAR